MTRYQYCPCRIRNSGFVTSDGPMVAWMSPDGRVSKSLRRLAVHSFPLGDVWCGCNWMHCRMAMIKTVKSFHLFKKAWSINPCMGNSMCPLRLVNPCRWRMTITHVVRSYHKSPGEPHQKCHIVIHSLSVVEYLLTIVG